MAFFHYKAIGEDGQQQTGSMESDSLDTAVSAIRERGLFVLEINESSSAFTDVEQQKRRLKDKLSAALPIMARDRAMLFRQLSMMLQTGLTLLQALQVCRQETAKIAFAKIIDRLMEDIESGTSLSAALSRHPKLFNSVTVQMIESAEASGELDTVMKRLSSDIERRLEQMVTMISALFYPIFVFLIAVLVSLFLVYGVIPKFATFIELKGGTLPASTQFLMDFSKAAIRWLPWIIAGIIGTVVLIIVTYRSPNGRLKIDRFLLDIPVIGGILTYAGMTRLGFTLSILLQSGLPLIESLRVAAGSMSNHAIRKRLVESREKIMQGDSLSSSLIDIIIPPTFPQVVAVGEQTGNLGEVLDDLGQYYDDRLQRRISWLSAVTEPVLIIVVGSMVGFVYYSFFMAALNMSTI